MMKNRKTVLQNIVESSIKSLTDELQKLESSLKPIKKDCTLDDAAHQGLCQEQKIYVQRYEKSSKRVRKLSYTLERIKHDDEYGVCQECDEDISFERLKLLPESTHCVECLNRLGL